jgi:hypothetical protein
MVEELLARSRLELGHLMSALETVRSILANSDANSETADRDRDCETAASIIGLVNEAMARLSNDLDILHAQGDASNVVQLNRNFRR